MRATLTRRRIFGDSRRIKFRNAFPHHSRFEDQWDLHGPNILGLRMNRGIAINLACRSLRNSTLRTLGEAQHIIAPCTDVFSAPDRAGTRCLWPFSASSFGEEEHVDRRRKAGQVVDFVNFDVQGNGDIVAQKFKARVCAQMFQGCAWYP